MNSAFAFPLIQESMIVGKVKPMKIYVAGPYSRGDTIMNVRGAILAAEEIIKKGHVPYIPHLTAFWHLVAPHEYKFWLEYDFEWLDTCDALYRIPGESAGAELEVDFMRNLGRPVYEKLEDIPVWDENLPI